MEVEVKLRLSNTQTFARVLNLLKARGKYLYENLQENYFIDGKQKELSSQKAILRLRRCSDPDSNTVRQCYITYKARNQIVDGISRVEELEEPIDACDLELLLGPNKSNSRNACVFPQPITQSYQQLASKYSLLSKVQQQHNVSEFSLIGCFATRRHLVEWRLGDGDTQLLELDHTTYDFGDAFELEAETSRPNFVRGELEALFHDENIEFSYSKRSKFANLIQKSVE